MSEPTLELWQTEWCPASHRVRQRLTELGLAYTVRQVPVKRDDRTELVHRTGERSIPVLVADGDVLSGSEPILTYLNTPITETPEADRQRAKAAMAKRKELGKGMSRLSSSYTLSTTTSLGFDETVARVRDELAAHGFGVLCEIDVQATIKQKLDVEREPYLILGACNPPLAHAALDAEPDLGALLPCNVVVYQEQGRTHIAAVDAERLLSIVDNDKLAPTAAEVRQRLAAVVRHSAES